MLNSITSPASVLLKPGQYVRLATLAGLAICLLSIPGVLEQPEITFSYLAIQFGWIVIFTAHMLGLNYYLLYRDTWARRQTSSRRSTFHIGANIIINVLTISLLHEGLVALGYPGHHLWRSTLLSGLLCCVIVLVLVAFLSLAEQAQYLIQENTQFKHAQLEARYEGLQQQLSPHFLFNSLATLRELIYEDLPAAERFVEEMTHVYRYLLHYSERPTVPLRDELSFLHSYAFLLQMRFGDGLVLHIDIPDHVLDCLLPPLALQILVENVVKHNIISQRHPMHLYIELREPNSLQVRNRCRPLLSAAPSSGTGLGNLANRVRLLYQGELLVERDTEFRVSLPLPPNFLTERSEW